MPSELALKARLNAAQLANESCRLPPPGSPPGPPPRRAPGSAGSRASRALLPPHAGITGVGALRRKSSYVSSPGGAAREPWRPRDAWGLREVRESRDYGSPGLGTHPRTGQEAASRVSYCFTLSPSASLKFFLAASSSLTKVAIAARVSARP